MDSRIRQLVLGSIWNKKPGEDRSHWLRISWCGNSFPVLADNLDASICLIEAKDRLLPQFTPEVSSHVQKRLSSKEVKLLTCTIVSKVSQEMITFSDGTSMDCDMAIWMIGIKPPELS